MSKAVILNTIAFGALGFGMYAAYDVNSVPVAFVLGLGAGLAYYACMEATSE